MIIDGLSLIYPNGVKAIDKMSLNISQGIFGLLGPNGAGKSSLMKTLVGLQKPSSGQVLFNNVDIIRDPDHIKRTLGYLPQEFGVLPKANAFQLLEHLAILKGIKDKSFRKLHINYLLREVNLDQHASREVYTFSGGMRQRFGLAQALLGNPQFIVVDEPTAGLDPEERNRINGILSKIGQQRIVLLSTHLVEDVYQLCAEMAILHSGKLKITGSPKELIKALEGKIWARPAASDEAEIPDFSSVMIRKNFIGGESWITVFSENRPDGFQLQKPTLEDFYFCSIKNLI
ncbi:ABC transporter ATP-binding protein [Algoriphagus confluentis]|uniref:ABC transporter ATP-binding protein n=2 Tax=Algoriphagus confluentis TaxID=1697556 RepID=A0ABQ6PRT5_9BACT|nr:ABC transporter ATP-binding protein [Algoriphagus confluentis]